MGRTLGAVPLWRRRAGYPSNTMWPGPRPTCTPSFIFIRPTVWPQYTNVTDRTSRTDRQDRQDREDRQTGQRSDSIERTVLQTVAQKSQRFWPPRWRVKSEPHQTWHSDTGLRARFCTSKTFWVRRIVSPLWAAENLAETGHHQFKNPIRGLLRNSLNKFIQILTANAS